MHSATLLDKQQRVLRPAILWNDGRCGEECMLLEESRRFAANHRQPDDAGFYGAEAAVGTASRSRNL